MAQFFLLLFIIIFSLIHLTKLLITSSSKNNHQQCILENQQGKKEGDFWIHQKFFNVTCLNGKIKVVNCVTEKGVQIPLGTANHPENGSIYSCKLNVGIDNNNTQIATNKTTNFDKGEQQSLEDVHECDYLPANGRAEYLRGGYAISCLNNHILGCIDVRGDLVRSGQLLILPRGQIAKCVVYSGGRWAKMEIKGCFNGTNEEDDPADRRFLVPKGRIWKNGNFELRCGEEGIQIYKCIIEGRRIHVGTAWVDADNVLNVCK